MMILLPEPAIATGMFALPGLFSGLASFFSCGSTSGVARPLATGTTLPAALRRASGAALGMSGGGLRFLVGRRRLSAG